MNFKTPDARAKVLADFATLIAAVPVLKEEISALDGGLRTIGNKADQSSVRRIRASARRIGLWIPRVSECAARLAAWLSLEPIPVNVSPGLPENSVDPDLEKLRKKLHGQLPEKSKR
jgi:hypothetical protein